MTPYICKVITAVIWLAGFGLLDEIWYRSGDDVLTHIVMLAICLFYIFAVVPIHEFVRRHLIFSSNARKRANNV